MAGVLISLMIQSPKELFRCSPYQLSIGRSKIPSQELDVICTAAMWLDIGR